MSEGQPRSRVVFSQVDDSLVVHRLESIDNLLVVLQVALNPVQMLGHLLNREVRTNEVLQLQLLELRVVDGHLTRAVTVEERRDSLNKDLRSHGWTCIVQMLDFIAGRLFMTPLCHDLLSLARRFSAWLEKVIDVLECLIIVGSSMGHLGSGDWLFLERSFSLWSGDEGRRRSGFVVVRQLELCHGLPETWRRLRSGDLFPGILDQR